MKNEVKVERLRTKVEILNEKIAQMQSKFSTHGEIVFNYQQNERIQHEKISVLEDVNEKTKVENITLKAEIAVLKDQLEQRIKKEDFLSLKTSQERLTEELTSTRAAMLSYKKMTEVIAEQAKNLKLMHERKKDEQENLLQALREMQAESANNDRIGKLYFIIMLSRWQEAAVNKKYVYVLNDVKDLRGELLRSSAHNNAL